MNMQAKLDDLNVRFGIHGLQFVLGSGGLIRAVIHTAIARGEIYLHGAHVTQFQPQGHQPVLWLSEQSYFEPGKPIRGGVPICFPWFGANTKEPHAPAHGLARITHWEVSATSRMANGGIAIVLQCVIDGMSLVYRVEFGDALQLELRVESKVAKSFEEALHSYFVVGDIQQVIIEGLEQYEYFDKVGNPQNRPATREAIRFIGEVDRVYLDTKAICILRDPILKRVITVRQSQSRSTIVWNPWIDKSARMPDFGNDEWPGMVCIETANVGDQAIVIEPGQLHSMIARIECTA